MISAKSESGTCNEFLSSANIVSTKLFYIQPELKKLVIDFWTEQLFKLDDNFDGALRAHLTSIIRLAEEDGDVDLDIEISEYAKMNPALNKPPYGFKSLDHSSEKLFYLLSLTEKGRSLISLVLPLMRGQPQIWAPNQLQVEWPLNINCALKDFNRVGEYSGDHLRMIRLSPRFKLLAMVPTLAHELTHALDDNGHLNGVLTQDLKLKKILTEEHRALFNEAQVAYELRELISTLNDLDIDFFPALVIGEDSFRVFMIESYVKSPDIVDRYIKENPWSLPPPKFQTSISRFNFSNRALKFF